MRSWDPGGKGRWKKCQPQQFSRDARFRPLAMLAPDTLLPGKLPNKLISNGSRMRCSPDIARCISSWTAGAAGLLSV
jgi:hypothetical protein